MRPGSIVLAVLLSAAVNPVLAQTVDNALTLEERAAGWRLLFDGRTMGGWDAPAKSPPGDAWRVEDGCLRTVAGARISEDLLTVEEFGDFELVFDWRISPGGNSGVKYRIQDHVVLQPGKFDRDVKFEDQVDYELRNRLGDRTQFDPTRGGQVYEVAFEYQVVAADHPDALRGTDRTAGALYGLVGPSEQAAKPAGEFNHSRIVLRGGSVEHWLNGVRVVSADLRSEAISKGLASRWIPGSRVHELLTGQPRRRSPISLQHHGDDAWFRNIKIRPL